MDSTPSPSWACGIFLNSFDLLSAHAKPQISSRFTYPPAPAKGLDACCGWLPREAANVRHTAIA